MFDHYDHVSGLPRSCSGAEQDLKRAHAEVEQLLGELHQMRDLSSVDLATIDELRGEITALTATLASLRAALARAEETAAEARREAHVAALLWVADSIDPGPSKDLPPAIDQLHEGARSRDRGLAHNLRFWARQVTDGVISVERQKWLAADAPAAPTAAIACGPGINEDPAAQEADAPAASVPYSAVWIAIAAARREIDYHTLTGDLRRTSCGRSAQAGGVILARADAVQRYAARPCPRCEPGGGQP